MTMARKRHQKLQILLSLALFGVISAETTESVTQKVIPGCAQQCVQNSISSNFKQACPESSNFICLCTNYASDGYTLGEAALSCLYSSVCGQDALQSATAVYQICNGISNAAKPTHSSVVGSIFGASTLPSGLPTPTPSSTASSSITAAASTKSVSNPPASQSTTRKLDTTQIVAVVIASISLFVVAVTAVALMCLRSRRKPLDVEDIKALCNNLDDQNSASSRGGSSHSHEKKKPRFSFTGRPSHAKDTTRTWPKYYRVSPPPHLRLSALIGLSSSNKSDSTGDRSSILGKVNITKKPSSSNSRRTVRVSGFAALPSSSTRKPVPPERSPLRASAAPSNAPSLRVKIPETPDRKPPVRVYDPATKSIDLTRTPTPGSSKPRNIVFELSNAVSSHPAYHLPLNASGERVQPRRSEASSTYSTVESSPSVNRQRKSQQARKSSRKSRGSRGTTTSGRSSSHSNDQAGSETELRSKKEVQTMSPLAESPIANLSYPKVPRATTPNLVPRSNNSTPKSVSRGRQTPNSHTSSASTIRQSNTAELQPSLYQSSRTPVGQKRWITNSAPSLGPAYVPDITYTPVYHYSREIEQQVSLQHKAPAISWPGAKVSNTYGFF